MIIHASEVIGRQVITIENGKQINKVKDIIYDPTSQIVSALVLESDGLFSNSRAIPLENIHSIGEDAVIIKSEDALRKTSELSENIKSIIEDDDYLTKSKVISQDGQEFGQVTDMTFETETGHVQHLIVSQGKVEDFQSGIKKISPQDIITVGEDALIISTQAVEHIHQQAQSGGMKGVVSQAKESWESDETQNNLDQVKHQVSDAADNAVKQASNLFDKAKDRLEQVKDDPENRQKFSDLKNSTQSHMSDWQDTLNEKESAAHHKQEDAALGQYITRNILDHNDHIIARRGDMVTQSVITQAKQANMIDNVLNNLSKSPIPHAAGVLGGEVSAESDDTLTSDTEINDPHDRPL